MTISWKKLSATGRLSKVESRISTPLSTMVNYRRAAAGRRHSGRLNAHSCKAGLRRRLGLSARSEGRRLRLSKRA
jgi:hypothetical protein